MTPQLHHSREAAARAITAVGLFGVGILSSVVVAVAVVFTRSRAAFLAAAGLAGGALAGFVLSRTTGLPSATGDIGNWTEPLGLASMFVEGAVLLMAGAALATPSPALA